MAVEDETANFTVTTSDMPVIEAQTVEPEPTPKPTEDQKEDPKPNEEEQPRKKSRARARIETLAAEKRELQRQIDEMRQSGTPTPKGQELNPDDFDDYDDYLDAVEKQSSNPPGIEDDPAAAFVDPLAGFRDEMEAKFDDARDAHPDFDDKIKAMPTLTVDMLEAITESDDAGEVAYYLAHNPEVASKMAGMSFAKMAIEIGKIELKLQHPVKDEAKQPPKQKQTQAPEPIKPVGGVGEYDKPLEEMSFSEFEAQRNAQENAKKFW